MNKIFSNEIEIDDGSYQPFTLSQLKKPIILITIGIVLGAIIAHYVS